MNNTHLGYFLTLTERANRKYVEEQLNYKPIQLVDDMATMLNDLFKFGNESYTLPLMARLDGEEKDEIIETFQLELANRHKYEFIPPYNPIVVRQSEEGTIVLLIYGDKLYTKNKKYKKHAISVINKMAEHIDDVKGYLKTLEETSGVKIIHKDLFKPAIGSATVDEDQLQDNIIDNELLNPIERAGLVGLQNLLNNLKSMGIRLNKTNQFYTVPTKKLEVEADESGEEQSLHLKKLKAFAAPSASGSKYYIGATFSSNFRQAMKDIGAVYVRSELLYTVTQDKYNKLKNILDITELENYHDIHDQIKKLNKRMSK